MTKTAYNTSNVKVPHTRSEYVSATSAPTPEPAQPSLYRLLSTYWDRYDAHDKTMKAAEKAVEGTAEYAIASKHQSEAGDEVEEACAAVCAFVPKWKYDAWMKTNFVSMLAKFNSGCLQESEVEALLSSLPTLVDCRREGGAK